MTRIEAGHCLQINDGNSERIVCMDQDCHALLEGPMVECAILLTSCHFHLSDRAMLLCMPRVLGHGS